MSKAPIHPLHLFLATLAIVSTLTACQPGGTDAEAPTDGGGGAAATEAPTAETEPPPPDASSEVSYEPAYPEDVSSEGLSEDDVAQQETHSHGGEEHSHDEDGIQDDHKHDD